MSSSPAFTCPVCGRTSHHPEDLRQGYCGACHAYTGAPRNPGVPSKAGAPRPMSVEAAEWQRGAARPPWLGPRIARALRALADVLDAP